MYRPMTLAVGLCVLIAGVTSSVTSSATVGHGLVSARQATRSVAVVEASEDVTEGRRFSITVRVTSPKSAKSVQIQTETVDYAGTKSWTPIKSVKVRSEAKHAFKLVATGVGAQRFRALAVYRDGRSAVSKPVGVTVWRWTDLYRIPSYYETSGISNSSGSQFGMNGDQYLGWVTYGDYGMWEERFTPGRNCKAFRGVFGVTDSSADGSSAEFTLLTGDSEIVYQSPSLVPGAVETVRFDIANPYRFHIQARNTSTEDVRSYPAIGLPQFLCNAEF